MREQKIIRPIENRDPKIGQWLWAMQDARRRTLETLNRVTPEMVDWQPGEGQGSIGSILYHLAAIELDWLYEEVLEKDLPDDLMRLFPHAVRSGPGHLTFVPGEQLHTHLQRMEAVRGDLIRVFREMEPSDFSRVRSLPNYDVTPGWVLHHLLQHEAEHRSEIDGIRIRFEAKNK